MNERINLNQGWKLRYEEMDVDVARAAAIQNKIEGWMNATLPCDIHQVLLANNLITEPLVANQAKDSEWIEKKSWWFTKEFTVTREMLVSESIRMELNGLDFGAKILINGVYVAEHRSSHYPWIDNVKEYLQEGKNIILVRLTCGYEQVSQEDVYGLRDRIIFCGGRGDTRRAFIRKPQFVSGWDWAPKAVTCGITGNAILQIESGVVVRDFQVSTVEYQPDATLAINVELENMHVVSTRDAKVMVEITKDGEVICQEEKEMVVRAGKHFVAVQANIVNPQLWWPNGYGAQERYEIKVSVISQEMTHSKEILYGIRKIELDQSRINESERIFAVKVNGVKIFSTGANWVPADSIYARISDHKYRVLIEEAKNLNFNMLRIWGGGIFEPDIFYDLCDELGILIWHDFMYACSIYPEYNKEFLDESYREADYQTKRLRNHPCLAIWCGNNEMHWIFSEEADYKVDSEFMKKSCNQVFNHILPEVVAKNIPDGVYWNSSPYGGPEPSSELMGDNHIWTNARHPELFLEDFDTYDCRETKFMSEYGYTGPCKRKSVEEYCGKSEITVNDPIYSYHSHFDGMQFEDSEWYRGLVKHYGEIEINDFDQYLLYGGLTQGEILQYSLEAYQSKPNCSGALMWMYDDAWGEDGWTMVDYYLRRKPCFHFVKRALEPIKMILKAKENQLVLTLINDTDKELALDIEIGYQSFDAKKQNATIKNVVAKPMSREHIIVGKIEEDIFDGIYYGKVINRSDIGTAYMRATYMKNLHLQKAEIACSVVETLENETMIQVESSVYAHGVHFDFDADIRLSDDYFDILAGEVKTIRVEANREALPELIQASCAYPVMK